MSLKKNSSNEDSIFEQDLLSVFNGYCKINLEVPQISLFYTSDSLLPINAKVSSNSVPKNTDDNMTDIFNLKINENVGKSASKSPSSDHSNSLQKKDDNRSNSSPKSKRKKNKNKIYTTTDNQSFTKTEINASIDHNDQYINDKLEGSSSYGLQDQENKKKRITIMKNPNIPRSQTSQQNSKIENELISGLISQCPLCFGSYPTLDIEMHAARCNP